MIFIIVSIIKVFLPKYTKPIKPDSSIMVSSTPASYSDNAVKGKQLFMAKCAACHQLFKDLTGPSLFGFEDRGPWKDRTKLYGWIRNPAAFMKKDAYTKALYKSYGSMMTGFADITDEEIDAIVDYINESERSRVIY